MKSNNLLKITGLHVSVGDKEILHGVDLTVNSDETHVLMGPNGTGKSTLGYAITGNPAYTVTEGDIVFGGESNIFLFICASYVFSVIPKSAGSAWGYTELVYKKCLRAENKDTS